MSTQRPSFRETAAQRLAEGPAELPAAVEEFLSDTRRMAVRVLPLRAVSLADDSDEAAAADAADAGPPAAPGAAEADAALAALVESVREHGVLEPILVRPLDSGRYEVVAGVRRVRAARLANIDAIPAVVRDLDAISAGALAASREVSRAIAGRPELVRMSEPVRIGDAPRPRRTTGTYMPPAVVTRREPIVISGPGIPGPAPARREVDAPEPERRAAGDDLDRRPRFRFTPFPFLRRPRSRSGEHR